MKNLGFLVLLVFANTVVAETNDTQSQDAKLSLAMHELVAKQPRVEIRTESVTFDQYEQAVLDKVNAKLEQQLEQELVQELDQLLSDQVAIVE